MSFNYAAFKAAFKASAEKRGIDLEQGATEAQARTLTAELRYAVAQENKPSQIALKNAKQRVETHHDRALADFNAHIQRHKFQFVTDAQADLMRAKDWWAQDKEMWRGGAERGRTFRISESVWTSVLKDAVSSVFHEAKRLEKQRPKEQPRLEIDPAAYRALIKEVLSEERARRLELSCQASLMV